MKSRTAIPLLLAAVSVFGAVSFHSAQAQTTAGSVTSGADQLALTPAQRRAIYAAASKDSSKRAPTGFPAQVGAEVPPMIELYPLPDDAVSGNDAAKLYRYTLLQDKVVLVDPTKMRVVEVIGPSSQK